MSKDRKNGLFYIKAFLVFFSLVLIFSVSFRLYNSYKNSNFKDNSFNILILADNYVGVTGLDENEGEIYSSVITNELESIRKRNILIQSINFGIPIHGYIEFPDGVKANPPNKKFFSLDNIQSYLTRMDIKKGNISLFDWLKIYKISSSAQDEAVIKTYATIEDLSKLLPIEDENFFRNSDVSTRKTSLQVINATSINGLGNRVGEMFSRFGFNVVAVNTNSADKSEILYSGEDYLSDAMLISKTFDFPVVFSNKYQVADITLVIGEDSELLLEDITN